MPKYKDLKEKNPNAFIEASRQIGDQVLGLDGELSSGRMRLKSEAKKICESEGVNFWEIVRDNLPEKYFVDQCHLNKEGHIQKARFVYKNLINFFNGQAYDLHRKKAK